MSEHIAIVERAQAIAMADHAALVRISVELAEATRSSGSCARLPAGAVLQLRPGSPAEQRAEDSAVEVDDSYLTSAVRGAAILRVSQSIELGLGLFCLGWNVTVRPAVVRGR